MRSIEALGVLDVTSYAMAMATLDGLLKSANVQSLYQAKDLGGQLVTLFIGGGVSEVTAVIEKARAMAATGEGHGPWLKNAVVITKPHPGILDYVLNENGDAYGDN